MAEQGATERRDRSKPEDVRTEFWERVAGATSGERLPGSFVEDRAFHDAQYGEEDPQAVLSEMIETGWSVSDALIAEAATETGEVDEQELRDRRDHLVDRLVQGGWAAPERQDSGAEVRFETSRDDLTMTRDEWEESLAGAGEEAALIVNAGAQADGQERGE